jgi:hypothetical protein
MPHSGGLLPEFAVVLDMCPVDAVVVLPMEHTELPACTSIHDREVVEQVDGPVVQPHMVVGTQAQDVLRNVRTEMRPAERADMSSLGVRAGGDLEGDPTDLASIGMPALDSLGDGAVADLSLHDCCATRNWPCRSGRRLQL